jgi:hypothetical protein
MARDLRAERAARARAASEAQREASKARDSRAADGARLASGAQASERPRSRGGGKKNRRKHENKTSAAKRRRQEKTKRNGTREGAGGPKRAAKGTRRPKKQSTEALLARGGNEIVPPPHSPIKDSQEVIAVRLEGTFRVTSAKNETRAVKIVTTRNDKSRNAAAARTRQQDFAAAPTNEVANEIARGFKKHQQPPFASIVSQSESIRRHRLIKSP